MPACDEVKMIDADSERRRSGTSRWVTAVGTRTLIRMHSSQASASKSSRVGPVMPDNQTRA